MPVFGTLYRTHDLKDFPEGEYFQPRLDSAIVDGKEVFFVTEKHAYVSDTLKSGEPKSRPFLQRKATQPERKRRTGISSK
jgi:hypothetical protein